MSADFVSIWCILPFPLPNEELVHARIDQLTPAECCELYDLVIDDGDDIGAEVVTTIARSRLKEAYTMVLEGGDYAIVTMGDLAIVFTGGMTYGDAPTEAYAPIRWLEVARTQTPQIFSPGVTIDDYED